MTTRLQQLLSEARAHVPLYRELWAGCGENLAGLPVLSRQTLREFGAERLLDTRYSIDALSSTTTSGSTGEPLRIWRDEATLRRRQLRTFSGLWHVGHRPWQRFLWLELLVPGDRRKTSLTRRLLRISYLDLAASEPEIVREYCSSRADLVYGQFSALLLIAQGLSPGMPRRRPSIVVGFGEQLTAGARLQIESAFGTPLTEFYGIAEVGLIACRRPGQREFRQVGRDLLLEFLPAEDAPGYERLLVTTLVAGPMPFIRYDTGDLVRRDLAAPGQPIIEISGRSLDFLALPDGRRVAPYRIDLVLDEIAGLLQYRLIQQEDMSIDLHVELGGQDNSRTQEQIRSELEPVFDRLVPLRIHVHAQLPQTGGKLRLIQSLVR